jgi:hypothetical protein
MTRVADLEKDLKRSDLENVFNIPFGFTEHLPKEETRSIRLFGKYNEGWKQILLNVWRSISCRKY